MVFAEDCASRRRKEKARAHERHFAALRAYCIKIFSRAVLLTNVKVIQTELVKFSVTNRCIRSISMGRYLMTTLDFGVALVA